MIVASCCLTIIKLMLLKRSTIHPDLYLDVICLIDIDTEIYFLILLYQDFDVSITNGRASSKIYEIRDYFNFVLLKFMKYEIILILKWFVSRFWQRCFSTPSIS